MLISIVNLTVIFALFFQNVNDSNLRQLYIKAFNSLESRLETTTGLLKAVHGRYGFFVSATLARRALETTLIQERCNLKELALPQTFTVVALPMANSCPYKKIINLKYVDGTGDTKLSLKVKRSYMLIIFLFIRGHWWTRRCISGTNANKLSSKHQLTK